MWNVRTCSWGQFTQAVSSYSIFCGKTKTFWRELTYLEIFYKSYHCSFWSHGIIQSFMLFMHVFPLFVFGNGTTINKIIINTVICVPTWNKSSLVLTFNLRESINTLLSTWSFSIHNFLTANFVSAFHVIVPCHLWKQYYLTRFFFSSDGSPQNFTIWPCWPVFLHVMWFWFNSGLWFRNSCLCPLYLE